jgi:hypothetical protein
MYVCMYVGICDIMLQSGSITTRAVGALPHVLWEQMRMHASAGTTKDMTLLPTAQDRVGGTACVFDSRG